MAPITYRLSRPDFRIQLTLMWMLIGCAVASVALHALQIWLGGSPDYGLFLLIAPALTLMAVPRLLSILPKRNFMALDDAGLGYVRMGVRQWWSWQDLPAVSVTTRNDAPPTFFFTDHANSLRVVDFRPPAARDRRARLARWFVWAAADGWSHRAIRLYDHYDASIDEIAAALNEHRERALAGAVR